MPGGCSDSLENGLHNLIPRRSLMGVSCKAGGLTQSLRWGVCTGSGFAADEFPGLVWFAFQYGLWGARYPNFETPGQLFRTDALVPRRR